MSLARVDASLTTTLAFVLLFVSSAPAQAQQDLSLPTTPPGVEAEVEGDPEASPPPEAATGPASETPTEDAESAEAPTDTRTDAPILTISSPVDGSVVGVATIVEGTATPRASVELYIDGTLEQRTRADSAGRFRATVSGLEPNTRTLIEVRELDARGDVVSASSVVAKVLDGPTLPAVAEPAVVEEPAPATEPEPAPDPVIVYELTSNPSRRAAEQGVSMTPLVAPTAEGEGAVVGVAGTW